MPKVFISYRRSDSAAYAGRLRDRLAQKFGARRVFLDVNSIGPGERFSDEILRRIRSSDALLALIGPSWLSAQDEAGRRRLDDPDDLVRREIGEAFANRVSVIPVLLENAPMPARANLPPELQPLAERNAYRLTLADFDRQATELIRFLDGWRRLARYAAAALLLVLGGLVLSSAVADYPVALHRRITGQKLVLVMDSGLLIYGRDRQNAGRTNYDDIYDVLRDVSGFDLDLRRELTYPAWRREAELRRLDPDVIIIHASCFYSATEPGDPDARLVSFLRDMESARAKFLVYSRDRGILTRLEKLQQESPRLRGRIHFYEVPGAMDAMFQDPRTGREFRTRFTAVLRE